MRLSIFIALLLFGCTTTTYKTFEHQETAKFRKRLDFSIPLSSEFKINDIVVYPSMPKFFPDQDLFRLDIVFISKVDPLSSIEVTNVQLVFHTDNVSYPIEHNLRMASEFEKQWSGHKTNVHYYLAGVSPFSQPYEPININSTATLTFTATLSPEKLIKHFKYELVYKETNYALQQ